MPLVFYPPISPLQRLFFLFSFSPQKQKNVLQHIDTTMFRFQLILSITFYILSSKLNNMECFTHIVSLLLEIYVLHIQLKPKKKKKKKNTNDNNNNN